MPCPASASPDDAEIDTFLKLYVLLYADDSIILAESAEELQRALNALHDYCKQNDIIVNTDHTKEKTRIIIFSKGKTRKFPIFTYDNDTIDVVHEYTYLGIRFKYNGNFDVAIAQRVQLARGAMFKLIRKSSKMGLSIDTQIELFEKNVLPITLYGCEIWGSQSNIEIVEILYRSFIKQVLKLDKGTPSCMIYGEIGKTNVSVIVMS